MQVLSTKYNTEEGGIQKDIDFGSSLLHNDDLQNEACKGVIRSDVETYTRKKSKLRDQLQQCKTKYATALHITYHVSIS